MLSVSLALSLSLSTLKRSVGELPPEFTQKTNGCLTFSCKARRRPEIVSPTVILVGAVASASAAEETRKSWQGSGFQAYLSNISFYPEIPRTDPSSIAFVSIRPDFGTLKPEMVR